MRYSRWYLLAFAVISHMFFIRFSAAQFDSASLTLWHYFSEDELGAVQTALDAFSDETGMAVELVAFDSAEQLLQNLTQTVTPPDLYLGHHTWGNALYNNGLATAYGYCPADVTGGACELCASPNPPPSCQVMFGTDLFRETGFTDLASFEPGSYCTPDGCHECFTSNPPSWCLYAQGELEVTFERPPFDVLQLGMTVVIETPSGLEPFPNGIPFRWDLLQVFAREPDGVTALADLRQLAEDGEVFYDRQLLSAASFSLGAILLPQDPIPDRNDAQVIVSSLGSVRVDDFTGFEPVILTDYHPDILIHGIYAYPQTAQPEATMQLLYEFAEEDVQQQLWESGFLPAHGSVLTRAMEENTLLATALQTTPSVQLVSSTASTAATPVCVDFNGGQYVSGDRPSTLPGFLNAFVENGFVFTALSSSTSWVINTNPNGLGLQFNDPGLQIGLPQPSNWVLFRGFSANQDYAIRAFNNRGASVDRDAVRANGTAQTILLTGGGISELFVNGIDPNTEMQVIAICVG